MQFTPFTSVRQSLAVLAGVIGAGVLVSAPAIAQGYSNPSQDDATSYDSMQQMQMPMNQSDSAAMNLVEVASSSDSFNTLTQAIQAAGLTDTLAQGQYTVFAPTDEAFSQLPEGTLDFLLQPENQDILRQVLTYHVLPNEVAANEITGNSVEALGGGLAIRVAEDRIIVNNASVIQPNIQASNGVIHGVNRVLLPESLQQTLASRLNVQNIYQ